MEQEGFKYYAFISYSHRDQKIAKKLQRHLEKYHLPSALLKTHPELPKKLSPVFIDELDLVAPQTLKSALQANLDRSNYIILICSPNSAHSEYVNDEIEYFIKIGRGDHIIPFIVGGEPHAKDPSKECFPPALLALSRENELLGIDLTKFGEHGAFVRIIATLLNLDIDDFVARDAKERKRKKIILASFLVALLIVARLLMPPPYDETLAENVIFSALGAYVRAGHQYERLHDLTDCAENSPMEFSQSLQRYKNQISLEGMNGKNALQYLSDMMDTGKVMPWSGKPINHDECAELLQLPEIREEEYKLFSSVLEFVMSDDYAQRYYGSQYPKLLNELLEIDADITSELYQIVCVPHLTGKYGNNSTTAQAYANLFTLVPRQNKHLTGEDVKQSKESLTRLKGTRDECLSKLNSLGVFDAYNRMSETKPTASADSAEVIAEKLPELEGQPEDRMLHDLFKYIYI